MATAMGTARAMATVTVMATVMAMAVATVKHWWQRLTLGCAG
jgi:hypothetical protein